MQKYSNDMSNYILLGILATAGFMAQPTIAAGVYMIIVMVPLLVMYKLYSHLEGYREARDDYAPGQSIKGHTLYKVLEWLETPHLGIRGIWVVILAVFMLTVWNRFR